MKREGVVFPALLSQMGSEMDKSAVKKLSNCPIPVIASRGATEIAIFVQQRIAALRVEEGRYRSKIVEEMTAGAGGPGEITDALAEELSRALALDKSHFFPGLFTST